jgi:hypothetical protein
VFDALVQALAPIVEKTETSWQALEAMVRNTDASVWSGPAAEVFTESLYRLPSDLETLFRSHQSALRALQDYSSTLATLQGQANQVLLNASGAQGNLSSASGRLSSANGAYANADGQYSAYQAQADTLQVRKTAADAAGDLVTSAQLAAEILSVEQARNAAWSARAAAAGEIQAAQTAINTARSQLEGEQGIAQRIALERSEAAEQLAHIIAGIAGFAVAKRSWFDRVKKEFDSAGGFSGLWKRVESDARPYLHDAESFDKSFGWFLGPVGGAVSGTLNALQDWDSDARILQNLWHHHWDAAQEEIADKVAPKMLADGVEHGDWAEILGAVNVVIWSEVVDAGSKIDWGYTFHHLSDLNPINLLHPGVGSSVWHAEVSGFEDLGKRMFGMTVSAASDVVSDAGDAGDD